MREIWAVGPPCLRRESPSVAVGSLTGESLGGVLATQTPVHDLVSESVGPRSLSQKLQRATPASRRVANTETKFYGFRKRNLPGFLASNTMELRRPAHVFR